MTCQKKKVSFQKGDVVERIIKRNSYCIPVQAENQEQAIEMLLSGSTEAFIGNCLTGLYYLQTTDQLHKIKIVGDPLYNEKYSLVTLKNNSYVFDLLNHGIRRIKNNGIYKKIYRKWFGQEFGNENKSNEILLIILLSILVIIIIFYIISLWINKKLQNIVSFRTHELEKSKQQLESTNILLHNLAYYDPLTHLPNRVFFNEKIDLAISNFKKNSKSFSVMYIDLDNFKYINDTFGHSYGDEILKESAERFNSIKGECIFARLGGDEFAVIIYNDMDEKSLEKKASHILSLINHPYYINFYEVNLSASIGIVICNTPDVTREYILRDADIAMYKAKETGKNRYIIFNKNMNDEISEKLMMSNALLRAIENDELSVHYQPIYNTVNNEIICLEALLRWHSKDYGQVSPEKFIKLAEETGIIHDIGLWTIEKSCLFAKEINNCKQDIVISINLSPIQLLQDNFTEMIDSIVTETGTKYEWIGLEITESALIDSFEKSMEVLLDLKEKGAYIYLDDFGIGYSSLNYLWRLPISTVKIDRSFIQSLKNKKVEEMTKSIINLFEKLNLRAIAEGVESKEQLELLTSLGCTSIQGFFFSKPLSEEAALALVKGQII